MERFLRTELLVGKEKLEKIKSSFVTVIGLGAVGSYAVEALARSGVGRFRLVDFDCVEKTNINRQLFAFESTIGEHKAKIAKKRILDINPKAEVEALKEFVREDTLDMIFNERPDCLVDAIDSLNPKVDVLAGAYERGIKTVSSMGAALRTEPSDIRAGDLFDSAGCPLARFMRKRLRRRGVNSGIFCVYSPQVVKGGLAEPEKDGERVELDGKRGRDRNVLGSLSTIPGIFGLYAAHYALEYICEGF